jgi:hypothetical protein
MSAATSSARRIVNMGYRSGVRTWAMAIAWLATGCQVLFPLEEGPVPPPTDGSSDGSSLMCPNDYVPGESGTGYKLRTTPLNWFEAKAECENDGLAAGATRHTHLVVVTDEAELQVIGDLGADNIELWLGLTDREREGVFRWITDELTTFGTTPLIRPWDDNQPNGGTTENCAVLVNNGDVLNDLACSTVNARASVCECDDFVARSIPTEGG